MKRGEKWFSEKLRKNFDLDIFGPTHSRYVPPVSRAPASELVLQREGLPSEVALPGESSSPPRFKRNLSSIGENRTLLRTVALVLLFITSYYYYYDPVFY